MADNQGISNLLNVVETKLKDLETQLELARARTETIEAHVETIKALMKIDEVREKEAREKEILEKKPEILATITDDTCAPWEGSYVTGMNDHMTIHSLYSTDAYDACPWQETFEDTSKRIIENHAKESQNHVSDSFFIKTIGLYEDK